MKKFKRANANGETDVSENERNNKELDQKTTKVQGETDEPWIDKFNQNIRPMRVRIIPENIPSLMKKSNHWCCWKWEWNETGKKWTKPPCTTTGQTANHIALNMTFETAYTAYLNKPNIIAGIGYSFREDDNLCGVDIDGCIDRKSGTYRIHKQAKEAVKMLKSYTEMSPSGKGIRIIGIGKPDLLGSSKRHKCEIYNSKRYLTMTGQILTAHSLMKKSYSIANIEFSANTLSDLVTAGLLLSNPVGKNIPDEKDIPTVEKSSDLLYLHANVSLDKDEIAIFSQKMLNYYKADDYERWLTLGMCVHNEYMTEFDKYKDTRSEADRYQKGFLVWATWSRTAEDQFSYEECAKKWKGFGRYTGAKITFRTVKWDMKQANRLANNHNFKAIGDVAFPMESAMNTTPGETQYIISPIIPLSTCNMIHAKRGLGKTNFCLGLALASATGGSFLKWKATDARKTLYVDGELPYNELIRYIHLAAKTSVNCNLTTENMQNLLFLTADRFPDNIMPRFKYEGMEYLNGIIEERQIEVMFIDSLATVMQWSDDRQDDWQEVQQWIISWRNRGVVIILVHHDNKAGTGQRGFSNKEDVLNTIIHLRPTLIHTASMGACFSIEFSKSRGFYGTDAESFVAAITTEYETYTKTKEELAIEEEQYEGVTINECDMDDDGERIIDPEGKRIISQKWNYYDTEDFNTRKIAILLKEGMKPAVIASQYMENNNAHLVNHYRDKAVEMKILEPTDIKVAKQGQWANKHKQEEHGFAKPNPRRKKEQIKLLKEVQKEAEEKAKVKAEDKLADIDLDFWNEMDKLANKDMGVATRNAAIAVLKRERKKARALVLEKVKTSRKEAKKTVRVHRNKKTIKAQVEREIEKRTIKGKVTTSNRFKGKLKKIFIGKIIDWKELMVRKGFNEMKWGKIPVEKIEELKNSLLLEIDTLIANGLDIEGKKVDEVKELINNEGRWVNLKR